MRDTPSWAGGALRLGQAWHPLHQAGLGPGQTEGTLSSKQTCPPLPSVFTSPTGHIDALVSRPWRP